MGYEDKDYMTVFIPVPIQVWQKTEIGATYIFQPNWSPVPLKGEVIGKNAGELVVRFRKPRNVA